MKGVAKIVLAELAVAAIGVVFIDVFYIYVNPHYNDSHSVLILSLAAVAYASGYVARKLELNNRKVGWTMAVAISIAVTILTFNLAFFWIVNVIGS